MGESSAALPTIRTALARADTKVFVTLRIPPMTTSSVTMVTINALPGP